MTYRNTLKKKRNFQKNTHVLLIMCFLLLPLVSTAQNINIGLYYKTPLKEVVFEPIKGKYLIVGDGKLFKIKKASVVYMKVDGMKVKVSTTDGDVGTFDKVMIEKRFPNKFEQRFMKKQFNSEHVFRLNPVGEDIKARFYDDELKIKVSNDRLLLINDLDFDKYLAGVVEAETGPNALLEFYKAQATICRTYAVQNANKHKGEFFQLCDDVDCQAYKGRSTKNPDIMRAVKATRGLVIKDTDSTYINAVFSANCGGQTMDAEDLWDVPKSYLKSVIDPHCIAERQAHWSKTISLSAWRNYLIKVGFRINKNTTAEQLRFNQPNRKTHYKIRGGRILLRQLRKDWRLRSTFFSVIPEGNTIKLAGRGYGHGVGMCQEGAMNMAKKGFKFDEIIKFYYKDVKIVNEKF